MNILVTGATGYIGSCLVKRLLALGHAVTAVVLEGTGTEALQPRLNDVWICIYDGSLGSLARAIEQSKPDQVFHIASLFLVQHKCEDVDRLVASNILFPAQLLEAMDHAGIKDLINVGTSWQHYLGASYNPVNLYAATKQAFESLLEFYVQARGIKAITLKLFDTYGPGDSRPKLFSLLRKTARTGAPLKMSAGMQLLDLVYIDDVLEAFVLASRRLPLIETAETFGVASGELVSLRELVDIYAQVTKCDLAVEWGGLPYRPREVMTPWKGYNTVPGWKARTPLREGILRMEQDAGIGGLFAGPAL